MGPMSRGRKLNRRKVGKWTAVTLVGLMVWSLVAAPEVPANHPELQEPFDLSAYHTQADAAPIRSTLTHNLRLVELAPAIARSTSQVSLPSQAGATSWLAELGVANGLHGTTTGTKVFTEATASQPGGAKEEEFGVPKGGVTVGNEEHFRAQAGRSYATADHSDRPRGYGNAYLGNICIARRPGSPTDPPGTFDPDGTFPGGPEGNVPDPGPQNQVQQCVVSIGSAASTSESLREQSNVKSIAVSEVNGVNIGLRTADGSCRGGLSCMNLDFIRAEAFAEANGQPGGSRGARRVLLGRGCRRSFDGAAGFEKDTCFPLGEFGNRFDEDEESNPNANDLTQIKRFEELNERLEDLQVWNQVPGFGDTVIGVQLHAGTSDAAGTEPCESGERNTVYPEAPKADKDAGQVACATAEGISISITVIDFGPADEELEANPVYQELDSDSETPGLQLNPPIPGQIPSCFPDEISNHFQSLPNTNVSPPKCPLGPQTISTDTVRAMRRIVLKLGTASATALARPGFGGPPVDTGTDTPTIPEITIPTVDIPQITIPEIPAGGGGTTIIQGGGIGAGPLKLKIDWSSVKLKPWPAEDMAKGILSGGMLGLAGWLLRRRLGLG